VSVCWSLGNVAMSKNITLTFENVVYKARVTCTTTVTLYGNEGTIDSPASIDTRGYSFGFNGCTSAC